MGYLDSKVRKDFKMFAKLYLSNISSFSGLNVFCSLLGPPNIWYSWSKTMPNQERLGQVSLQVGDVTRCVQRVEVSDSDGD